MNTAIFIISTSFAIYILAPNGDGRIALTTIGSVALSASATAAIYFGLVLAGVFMS